MTQVYLYNSKIIINNNKVGIDPQCCCEAPDDGFCCFKSLVGSYSFSINGITGTIIDGFGFDDVDGFSFLFIYCTGGATPICDPASTERLSGLFLTFSQVGLGGIIVGQWHGYQPGEPFSYPCSLQSSIVGTYTMTNCATGNITTLTIE